MIHQQDLRRNVNCVAIQNVVSPLKKMPKRERARNMAGPIHKNATIFLERSRNR
jgi:hypothetical protein